MIHTDIIISCIGINNFLPNIHYLTHYLTLSSSTGKKPNSIPVQRQGDWPLSDLAEVTRPPHVLVQVSWCPAGGLSIIISSLWTTCLYPIWQTNSWDNFYWRKKKDWNDFSQLFLPFELFKELQVWLLDCRFIRCFLFSYPGAWRWENILLITFRYSTL